jgi:hypothetical protein
MPRESKEIEFIVTPNDKDVKLQWRADNSPLSKPIKINAELLERRSTGLRKALAALNEYVRRNPALDEARDPEWKAYRLALQEIASSGKALRAALLREDAGAGPLAEALAAAPIGTALKVSCSDEDVTFPFGFVCEPDADTADLPVLQPDDKRKYRPSLKDFERFWLFRFRISMLVQGSGCVAGALTVNPDSLRALYALHRTEFEASVDDLGLDCNNLRQFLKLRVGDHYDWNSAQRAWRSMDTSDSIVFVLAHSDGDILRLQDSQMESLQFKDMLEKRSGRGATLLILNCCLSATGAGGASLLSSVARQGFCGLVGTEAEILNSKALLFGTRLLERLLKNGEPLGDALDALQSDDGLFPLNLFYTCYADRSFKLQQPMKFDA